VCDTVEQELGQKLAVREAPRRPGDPAMLCAGPERLMRELGWRPHSSNLRVIVRSAWDWKQRHPRGYQDAKAKPVVLPGGAGLRDQRDALL